MQEIERGFQSTSKHLNVPITWCEDIRLVPDGNWLFVLPLYLIGPSPTLSIFPLQ